MEEIYEIQYDKCYSIIYSFVFCMYYILFSSDLFFIFGLLEKVVQRK